MLALNRRKAVLEMPAGDGKDPCGQIRRSVPTTWGNADRVLQAILHADKRMFFAKTIHDPREDLDRGCRAKMIVPSGQRTGHFDNPPTGGSIFGRRGPCLFGTLLFLQWGNAMMLVISRVLPFEDDGQFQIFEFIQVADPRGRFLGAEVGSYLPGLAANPVDGVFVDDVVLGMSTFGRLVPAMALKHDDTVRAHEPPGSIRKSPGDSDEGLIRAPQLCSQCPGFERNGA